MTISLLNKEQNVSIEPLIKCIYFNKIESYQDEIKKLEEEDEFFGMYMQVSEKIALEFDVLFKIENNVWKIPYVVILEKIYIKQGDNLKYIYRKGRARLQKFDEIVPINQTIFPFLVHTLLLFDRSYINYCSSQEFETIINVNTFYFQNDLEYNTNNNCIYKVSLSFCNKREDYPTNINLLPEEQFSFEGTLKKTYENSSVKGFYFVNIFPSGFIDSYKESFTDKNGRIVALYNDYSEIDKTIEGNLERFNTAQAFTKGDKLFQGSYKQCLEFIGNNDNIIEIKKTTLKKNIVYLGGEDSYDYYNGRGGESDYFDAMTDGQLGTYDEFIEGGGDIDNLENY